MDSMLRCRYMSYKFLNLAYRATNYPERTMLVDNTLDILGQQIEEKINSLTSTFGYPCTVPTGSSLPNDSLNTCLKKKEIQTRISKRKRSWLDKKKKFRKKRQNTGTSQVREGANFAAQAQVAQMVCSKERNWHPFYHPVFYFLELSNFVLLQGTNTRSWGRGGK